jgi:hypothetical protein
MFCNSYSGHCLARQPRFQTESARHDAPVEYIQRGMLGAVPCAQRHGFLRTGISRQSGRSPQRNFHLDIAARRRCDHACRNLSDVALYDSPLRISEHHHRNCPALEILLRCHVHIDRHRHFKACLLGGFQQLSVNQPVPTGIFRFSDGVAFKEWDQRCGRAMVKENEHRRFGRGSAKQGVRQDSAPRIRAQRPPVPASRPLRLPGMLSTAGHCDQARLATVGPPHLRMDTGKTDVGDAADARAGLLPDVVEADRRAGAKFARLDLDVLHQLAPAGLYRNLPAPIDQ